MTAHNTLQFKFAQKHVNAFGDESKLMQKRPAMNSLDCEALLQLGIEAYDWLVRADAIYRQALYAEQTAADAKFEHALEVLFRSWVEPGRFLETWISQVQADGYQPANLERFRHCSQEIQALIRFLDQDELSEAMRGLRDEAITEHDNGQTAEFV